MQEAGAANRIVCDCADSPAELVRLAQAKSYNCIFCDISVLDSVPYIHAIRKIQVTPIIIGAIEECKNISIFSRYIKITDQAAAAPRLAPVKVGDLRLYPEYRFASIHEREITLTTKEFDILSLLASNPKRVFTYERSFIANRPQVAVSQPSKGLSCVTYILILALEYGRV